MGNALTLDFVTIAKAPDGYFIESASFPKMPGVSHADPQTFLEMAWAKAQEVKPSIPRLLFMGNGTDLAELPCTVMPCASAEAPKVAA